MKETLPCEIKRWTAKRRTALVVQIIKGETTARKAAREYGLKTSDIQHWYDSFMSGGENSLRSRPREELLHKEHQIKRLKQKVGELVLDIDILKEAQAMINPSQGNFSQN